jgi:hypothetical protein
MPLGHLYDSKGVQWNAYEILVGMVYVIAWTEE